jgi:hypothetical protein
VAVVRRLAQHVEVGVVAGDAVVLEDRDARLVVLALRDVGVEARARDLVLEREDLLDRLVLLPVARLLRLL